MYTFEIQDNFVCDQVTYIRKILTSTTIVVLHSLKDTLDLLHAANLIISYTLII